MVGPAHQHRGWEVVEHGGSHGGYSAWMARFPELHLTVVVMLNYFLWEMRDYAIKLADLFLEDNPAQQMASEQPAASKETAAPVELSGEQLETKAGTYFNAERAALRDVTYAEGRLQYQGLDLAPLGENRFFFEKIPDTSDVDDFAQVGRIALLVERLKVAAFRQDELLILHQYAGRAPRHRRTSPQAARSDHATHRRCI